MTPIEFAKAKLDRARTALKDPTLPAHLERDYRRQKTEALKTLATHAAGPAELIETLIVRL